MLFQRFFGSSNDRKVKAMTARVAKINALEPQIQALSDEALLWSRPVRKAADFNGDSFLDFFDYDAFVACFEGAGCPAGTTADFNADGFVDFGDYTDFVAAFEAGA